MKNAQNFKKDLSNTIKHIRDYYFHGAYPKAMMGSHQIMNKTATVNCGGEWRKLEDTKQMAEKVMADREFRVLCAYNQVKATIEYNAASDAYQIRLTWE